jgi:type VI secretion system protein ImpK
MKEEIANLVHPVINYGLRLKERLERNEMPDMDTEQAALKGLLLSDSEARKWADFGGEVGSDSRVSRANLLVSTGRQSADGFLGIRYALVCWLDEIFILLDSPWSRRWNEQKLETQLYGTNFRAEWFPEQAERAESRRGSDALEVFFLCVMLGFRGRWREEPDKLQAWVSKTLIQLARGQGQECPLPAEHEPPTSVPPRHGRERLQKMVLMAGVLVLCIIPVFAFLVVKTGIFGR